MSLARRFGGAGLRRGIRGSAARVGAEVPDLAQQIIDAYAAASWVTPFVFLVRDPAIDLSLVSGRVERWVNHGTGSDATQATDTARPTYSATAVNSLPGMTLDGGDLLVTGNVDLSAYSAAALTILFSDTDTGTTIKIPVEFGAGGSAGNGSISIFTNNGVENTVSASVRGSVFSRAQSAASYSMASPAVVTATGDLALSSEEARIRLGGVDVSDSWPANGDNAVNYRNGPLSIGARNPGSSNMAGAIAAVILAAGTTAIPTSTVAAVEALIAAQWGL